MIFIANDWPTGLLPLRLRALQQRGEAHRLQSTGEATRDAAGEGVSKLHDKNLSSTITESAFGEMVRRSRRSCAFHAVLLSLPRATGCITSAPRFCHIKVRVALRSSVALIIAHNPLWTVQNSTRDLYVGAAGRMSKGELLEVVQQSAAHEERLAALEALLERDLHDAKVREAHLCAAMAYPISAPVSMRGRNVQGAQVAGPACMHRSVSLLRSGVGRRSVTKHSAVCSPYSVFTTSRTRAFSALRMSAACPPSCSPFWTPRTPRAITPARPAAAA